MISEVNIEKRLNFFVVFFFKFSVNNVGMLPCAEFAAFMEAPDIEQVGLMPCF